MTICSCSELTSREMNIAAGLDNIPRQIGTFADFRAAMLSHIRNYPALLHWRPCGQEDLGLMLLEMWAYMLDVQSFYDEVLGHEMWVRTARHRPSVRKLTALLGYVPRPAVSAVATLALKAEGRRAIEIPAGTAFRSGVFGDQPPQIFETTTACSLHPLHNSWEILPPKQTTVSPHGAASDSNSSMLLVSKDSLLRADDLVLISIDGAPDSYRQVKTIKAVTAYENINGESLKKVTFKTPVLLRGNFAYKNIVLTRATQTASLWTKAGVSGDPEAIDGKKVVLDGLYRRLIRANDFVVIERYEEPLWFQVQSVGDVEMTISPAGSTLLTDSKNKTSTISIPAVKAPVTQLTTRQKVEKSFWTSADTSKMTLHYGFESAAQVVAEPATELNSGDRLTLDTGKKSYLESPVDAFPPKRLLLKDKNMDGALVTGTVDYANAGVILDAGVLLENLIVPVTVFANVVDVSRGESVNGEVLGSGNASMANQFFKLKKGPLTYLNAATSGNEQGVVSTLRVYVDGVSWKEVNSFYGSGADDKVYIVRQGDEDDSFVFFGDGRHGSRLTTGMGNIVAYYRFGAGRAAPPAGTISQLAKPVAGVNGVEQVLDASAGDDAEPREGLRKLAPRSALLLGRAISIDDIEVVAIGVPGVEAAHVEWRWQARQQRPAVQVWYVGDVGAKTVLEKIRLLVSPSIPVDATRVITSPVHLSIDLEIDQNYIEDDVLEDVYFLLANEDTGVLIPANMSFKQSLVRSKLFFELLSVPGVVNVTGLLVDAFGYNIPWSEGGIPLSIESIIDFVAGGISLNGKEF